MVHKNHEKKISECNSEVESEIKELTKYLKKDKKPVSKDPFDFMDENHNNNIRLGGSYEKMIVQCKLTIREANLDKKNLLELLKKREEQLESFEAEKKGFDDFLKDYKQKNFILNEENNRLHKDIEKLKKQLVSVSENLTQKYHQELEIHIKKVQENEMYNQTVSKNLIAFKNECLFLREELRKHQIESTKNTENSGKSLELLNILQEENIKLNEEIKTLKDEIYNLKGNIRVFCRIRPENNKESIQNKFIVKENIIISNKNTFKFDHVFLPVNNQEDVYKEISFLINSLFDGYNVCIFLYGQTGSGKTYTMEGNEEERGIIFKSIKEIFHKKKILEAKGWSVRVEMQNFEIYNEEIYDLTTKEKKLCKIRSDSENFFVYNSNCNILNSENEAYDFIFKAIRNRKTGATNSNAQSSRSHSIYNIRLYCSNNFNTISYKSELNMIDLAGSERLNESGSEGLRLKETQSINRSLSALGNVIKSIMLGEPHVPYRSSKLTYFLKNSLNGTSKVLMIVNISPEYNHYNETICSLRFAQNVGECKLGKVITNKNIVV